MRPTNLLFETWDVFTSQPFHGNPLAVVYGAEALKASDLQSIAREFNLAESLFVLPPENEAHHARFRIFTPDRELPFAGHPSIGGAFSLARKGGVFGKDTRGHLKIEVEAGLMEMTQESRKDGHWFELSAPKDYSEGELLDPAQVAGALGIDPSDFDADNPPVEGGTGTPFVLVRARSPETLNNLDMSRINLRQVRLSGNHHAFQITAPLADNQFQARMFHLSPNLCEDPATGSAATAFMGYWLKRHPKVTEGKLVIRQGIEMGRPSVLGLRFSTNRGGSANIYLSGQACPVMEGRIEI